MERSRKRTSEADRRFIIGKSGGRCNKCRCEIFAENEFYERARLGDDAHIIAASPLGPRGQSGSEDKALAKATNLILLCKTCHSEVDQQPRKFTEEYLLQLRERHYAWIEASLGKVLAQRPKFHYLSYINVPRVDMYAVVNSIYLPQIELSNAQSFRDLGFQAGRLMSTYTKVLNDEALYANILRSTTKFEELEVGSYWYSSEVIFRSKKISRDLDPEDSWSKEESIIYRKYDGWKLVCLINPRWITTSTSFSMLSSGTIKTAGILNIKSVDDINKIAIASPLFLGAPDDRP
ncbi:HNH endonuclease [Pseudovibrio sp. SCP19]|uniref:HNH endonuclease n=1 Tax=Pseudovibrio sp. SCP19 TaxID=3141374 RepID=UPI003334C33F